MEVDWLYSYYHCKRLLTFVFLVLNKGRVGVFLIYASLTKIEFYKAFPMRDRDKHLLRVVVVVIVWYLCSNGFSHGILLKGE